jgi:predicted PurR-regulated permease PerM
VRRLTRAQRDIKIIRNSAVCIVILAIIAAMIAWADLLAPTAIAGTLALVLAPAASALERLKVPAGAAAVLTVVAAVFLIAAAVFALTPQVSGWVTEAPKIAQSIEDKLRPLTSQIAALERFSNELAQAVSSEATVSSVNTSDGFLIRAARTAPSVVETTVYVTILTIFLLAYRRHYTIQLILLPRTFQNRLRMARICRDVRSRVSGYLFILSLINIGLAAVTTICFTLAGISNAYMWGIAFGAFNYIPIIGPTSVIVVALIIGIATSDSIAMGLVPALILIGLNTIEANLVQPYLLSRRIVISPIWIFLMVVILVWMWGAAAAITAVPMLILFHTVAQHMPGLRAVAFMLTTENNVLAKERHRSVKHGPRKLWRTQPPQVSGSPRAET